ncbi:acyl carrier protein [Streptomyces mirabilis]
MRFTPQDERQLHRFALADREYILEEIVLQAFKVHLFMEDSDELSVDANFFDLGLTSLQLTEVKQQLERRLGCEVDTTFLFNNPTISHLLEHLDEVITRTAGGHSA